jgi:hypothetical protein
MEKYLKITRCEECRYCQVAGCVYNSDSPKTIDIYTIPNWCPLPSALAKQSEGTEQCNIPAVSGCFIVSNEKTPDVCEHYKVIYTDGTEGMEFFNGNLWLVKYKHPVKMWWLVLNNR